MDIELNVYGKVIFQNHVGDGGGESVVIKLKGLNGIIK